MEDRRLNRNCKTPLSSHRTFRSQPSQPVATGDSLTTGRLLTWLLLSVTLSLVPSGAWGQLAGNLVIAGNGPEQPTIEALARAFEKANPRTYVDVLWDKDTTPLQSVKTRSEFPCCCISQLSAISSRASHCRRNLCPHAEQVALKQRRSRWFL